MAKTKIQGNEIAEFRKALQDAFTPTELIAMLKTRLKHDLYASAALNATYPQAIFETIESFNRRDASSQLVAAAWAENPTNVLLYGFAQKFGLDQILRSGRGLRC